MYFDKKKVLLLSMPFAGIDIPSIQLGILESYLKQRDIEIETKHTYLLAAEIYGLNNYNHLIYPPNDSYSAQMCFSKYVFPDHWELNYEKFKEYFDKIVPLEFQNNNQFSFDDYIIKTDILFNSILKKIDWDSFDVIGFTLNYGQFLPSLSIAKIIKNIMPNKIIIFGGSRTTGELGKKVLESFDFIDFIVSGDGENALFEIANSNEDYKNIPNLIYRNGNDINLNQNESSIDINDLPIPVYDSYFNDVSKLSPDLLKFFSYLGRLPIEISRGCWWNKCSFCNIQLQHKNYREKNVEKIIEEIDTLSNKYKVLSFQIIGNTLPVKDYKILCEKIIELNKDLSFFSEARADNLKREDYRLLKKAGFNNIQTGIESFSNNYLKKMNKGLTSIDNIAALKFSKEFRIKNEYNIIVNFPNEDDIDFEETKKIIKHIIEYLDPPNICNLKILYGSPIHLNPQEYDIRKFDNAFIDKLMFPQNFLEKGFNFLIDINPNILKHDWIGLVKNWKENREKSKEKSIKTNVINDDNIFFFMDGKNFIKIYDKRNSDNINIFTLDKIERCIFLSCLDIITIKQIKNNHPEIPEHKIAAILHSLEKNSLVLREDDKYLALPLSFNNENNYFLLTENEKLIHSSGIHRTL